MNLKRIILATIIGAITGAFCISTLIFMPPAGIHPEIWFVTMIFYGRVLQGFTIGLAGEIPLNPLIRGTFFGIIFSGILALVPFFGDKIIPGLILIIYGMIYGIITDWLCSRIYP